MAFIVALGAIKSDVINIIPLSAGTGAEIRGPDLARRKATDMPRMRRLLVTGGNNPDH